MAVLRLLGALVLIVGLLLIADDVNRLMDGPTRSRSASYQTRMVTFDEVIATAGMNKVLPPPITETSTIQTLLHVPAGPTLVVLALLVLGLLRVRSRRIARRFGSTTPSGGAAATSPVLALDAFDREFLPAALELFETPPSPVRIAAIWVICSVFAIALAWSYFGWLDIYAVAQGRIHPNGRSKVVQPLEPGKVVAIVAENGRRVSAGDVLLELDPTETGADRETQARDLESVRAEATRRRAAVEAARHGALKSITVSYPLGTSEGTRTREDGVLATDLAQLTATRASLLAQHAEHVATRQRLTASIAARSKLLALAKERVDMRETLNKRGSLSRALVIDSLQLFETQMTTQVGESGQLAESEASLTTIERKVEETMAQFMADQMQKLTDAERRAVRLEQDLIKAQSKNERTTLRAPISGTVQQLAVTTVGQVVTSGQSLMTIVPVDGPIEIEALVQNEDIGFVEAGQPAVIKVEAFPFTRYGTIDGTVVRVSRDAVDEREANALSDPNASVRPQSSATAATPGRGQSLVFPATIRIGRPSMLIEGKEIPLSPGMAVIVEIRTGQRRAIDYVLSPLREVAAGFGHER